MCAAHCASAVTKPPFKMPIANKKVPCQKNEWQPIDWIEYTIYIYIFVLLFARCLNGCDPIVTYST